MINPVIDMLNHTNLSYWEKIELAHKYKDLITPLPYLKPSKVFGNICTHCGHYTNQREQSQESSEATL